MLRYFFSASVHFPRIGYNTPNFNWYGTEKLIKKSLAQRKIRTFVYPFQYVNSLHVCFYEFTLMVASDLQKPEKIGEFKNLAKGLEI